LANAPEYLDGPLDRKTLAGNLRDLARVNYWMGGDTLSFRALAPLMQSPGRGARGEIRFLDVGTGAADVPRTLLGLSGHSPVDLEIVATDVRPEILEIATATAAKGPPFVVRAAPPDEIDEPDASFDIVHSSMVLHHLEPAAAVAMLREQGRVARRAVIVNDLDRSDHWYLGARLLATLLTRNRYTRHDGPLSVRRAYRPNEVRQLARAAGLVEEALYWARPAYRYAFVFRPASAADG